MTYEPFASLKSATLGNTLNMNNNWGNDGRLAFRRLKTSTGISRSYLSYAYDNDDNITAIADDVTPANSRTYGYDTRGRLAQAVVQTGSAAFAREDYLYDANGNRTAVERRTAANDTIAAQTDSYTRTAGTNRLASITGVLGTRNIQYDARGNTLSESRTGGSAVTASYDGHARLISYSRSGEASLTHVYNGMDDRVSTITSLSGGGTDTRHFVYDPNGRVLGEYGANANDVKAEFIWMHPQVGESSMFGGDDGLGGYMPLAVAVPTATAGVTELNWVHSNHMGVPIYYSDASGAQLATPTGYSIPGFPGQSRTFTDLYYNRYRDYDSSTGRYVQADPIGLAGDVNPYLYALGNPLRYTDPSGLQAAVTAEKVIEVGFDWWWRRQLKPGRNTPWGRAWGAGEAIGAAIAVTRFIFNNCKDEGEDRARRCEENLDRDMLTCQALGKRGGKEAFRKCEEQAMLRYGNCLAGSDGPGKINAPLPPWSR